MKSNLSTEDYSALLLMHLWTLHGGDRDFHQWLKEEMELALVRYAGGDFQHLKGKIVPASDGPMA